ncbi:Spy/CpxP family protein refolding chaperone [Bradyrhizobium sp.]|uniref:Spy/CpxP family protein refolding chaperone n=1 Tax=Bradyrhizobium sp. TaxID=376 RepID=UPI00262503EC|nr:Spy/CpxP family protein refolding chaperone [Bradyrhizobium sp.]
MIRRTLRPGLYLGAIALILGAPQAAHAQGLVKGMQDGAQVGNKAAGPVGGVLGGAIGGVVGVFGGALGVNGNGEKRQEPPAANASNPAKSSPASTPRPGKATKTAKAAPAPAATPTTSSGKAVEVLTQPGAPELTAEQIVANSDAYIDRIKAELNLTPEQEKSWSAFNNAMHYLGHNGAERLNLRIARAKRDPPDDIVEQMRNEAQFLVDRAADQRAVADAAEPLFTSLDDKQKSIFIAEMVRLSHERGLD